MIEGVPCVFRCLPPPPRPHPHPHPHCHTHSPPPWREWSLSSNRISEGVPRAFVYYVPCIEHAAAAPQAPRRPTLAHRPTRARASGPRRFSCSGERFLRECTSGHIASSVTEYPLATGAAAKRFTWSAGATSLSISMKALTLSPSSTLILAHWLSASGLAHRDRVTATAGFSAGWESDAWEATDVAYR